MGDEPTLIGRRAGFVSRDPLAFGRWAGFVLQDPLDGEWAGFVSQDPLGGEWAGFVSRGPLGGGLADGFVLASWDEAALRSDGGSGRRGDLGPSRLGHVGIAGGRFR